MTSIPAYVQKEFETNKANARVGSMLVSHTEQVRVWHIVCQPGDRLPVHKHQLDYFWTIHGPGKARSHFNDGRISEIEYQNGDTQHHKFAEGEFFMHDLENIGDTPLVFTTVEFLESANPPLLIEPMEGDLAAVTI